MKKKITTIGLSALMTFSVMPMSAFSAFAEGTTAPTEITASYDWYSTPTDSVDVYEIDTIGELAGLAKLTQGAVEGISDAAVNFAGDIVKLTADIAFADNEYWYYTDISNYVIKDFAGTFDGNNKTINGLKLNGSGNYICLFNSIVSGGTVKNLTLDTVTVNGSLNWSGGIAGLVRDGATITGCTVTDMTVTGDSVQNFGAIASYVYGGGSVTGCNANNITVKSKTAIQYSGGLLGSFLANSTISNNNADYITLESTEGTSKYVGGLSGLAYGDISNCSADNVDITVYGGSYIGGFIGATFATDGVDMVKVEDCHATNVNIFGLTEDIGYHQGYKGDFQQSGGFIGMLSANNNLITGCTLTEAKIGCNGTLNGVGGFVGLLQKQGQWSLVMENCEATNIELEGATLVHTGGMIGLNNGNTMTVKDAILSNVTLKTAGGTNKVGGFLGYNDGALALEGCEANGVTMQLGDAESDAIQATGGFIGQMYGGTATVTKCTLTDLDATITGAYESSFGGFVGTQNGNTTFEQCSVSGKIDATNVKDDASTGGFLGDLGYAGKSNTTIDGCTADVDIDANGAAGGFVGSSWGYKTGSVAGDITVSNSTATGDVTSLTGAAGGFIGTGDRGTYENCEATGDVNGDVAGGFAGAITPNVTDMENKEVVIQGCDATGTVTGTSVASGLIGTVQTSQAGDENVTNVTILNDTATSVNSVNGETYEVMKVITPDGSTNHITLGRGFSVIADKKEVAVGETVTVTVMLNGTDLVGAKWTLVYDTNSFELVSGELNGEKIAGENGTFAASELLATYTFRAIVQVPIDATAFSVKNTDAWNLDEANASDDTPIPGDVSNADVTVVAPDYLVEVKENYVARKTLVLVYTNSEVISFNYGTATMYEIVGKYAKEGYAHTFAIVVDAEAYDETTIAIEYKTVESEYVLTYDATDYDLNNSGEFNLRDVTVVFGVYNVNASTFANYMHIVLNADIDGNFVVDGNDTAAFVLAYNNKATAN